MAKLSTMKFKGASGTEYDFDVYPFDTTWKYDVAAVYFVTRRYLKTDQKYYHEEIYVGQTSDLKTRHANHHRASCFFDTTPMHCAFFKNRQRKCDLQSSEILFRVAIRSAIGSSPNNSFKADGFAAA